MSLQDTEVPSMAVEQRHREHMRQLIVLSNALYAIRDAVELGVFVLAVVAIISALRLFFG